MLQLAIRPGNRRQPCGDWLQSSPLHGTGSRLRSRKLTIYGAMNRMARGTGNDGPHPVDRHVGRRVWEKRLELGYNQSDLARALGLTFQQIQKYEKGANRISASKLWDIARFLEVDMAYFFQGLDDLQGRSGTSAEMSEFDASVTRYSLEISRLAPRLTTRQQKLAAELIREMAGARVTNEP